MKKSLLFVSLLTAILGTKAAAQDTTTIQVYDNAIYYGMYEGVVSTPVPAGAIRNNNSSYGIKLTDEQIASIGNRLTLNVSLEALCDDYDRIGNVNLAFVPKGATSYVYANVQRIELARIITPFMNNLSHPVTQVPYTFDVDNVAKILHDTNLTADYDFWIELEVYAYQGDTSGGAVHDFPSICTGRNDVYKGSLQLVTSTDPTLIQGDDNFFQPLSFQFQMKDYVLATDTNNQGTDQIGETMHTIHFTLDEAVPNAYFHLVMSNHGSDAGGEEYKNRKHYVYLDGVEKLNFKPGKNCEQYRVYNTMPNGVYGSSPLTDSYWLTRSWCPGGKIDTRDIALGDLAAGDHTFKVNVPTATFTGDSGYFPMSAYFQGYSQQVTAGTQTVVKNNFSISPNPVNDIAVINTNGVGLKSVSIINTLGQTVFTSTSENVNMSQLQAGVYIVKAEFEGGQAMVKKVIKK